MQREEERIKLLGDSVKVPDALKDKVYFDEEACILYVDSKYTRRTGVFDTFLRELQKYYPELKVEESPDFIYRKQEEEAKRNVLLTERRIISELAGIFRLAAQRRASDIHIEVKGNACEVYFRQQGLLKKIKDYPAEVGDLLVSSLYNNASGQSHQSFSLAEFQYGQVSKNVSFLPPEIEAVRIQRGPIHGGHYMVLRLFYRTASLDVKLAKTFEETVRQTLGRYGYKESTILKVKKAIESGDGLIIVAGPTGSGKSTALKLFLELLHLLYPYKSIFTIENPPEYYIQGAKQLPVPQIEGWSFQKVLKEALRSDPDVIMVGEIREPETAKTAVDAALTGHQVFTTVHARDVITIIDRLKGLDVDLESLVKGGLVRLMLAQRLVPKLCPHCKEGPYTYEGVKGYFSKGCDKCEGTGVAGRLVIEEALDFNELAQLERDEEVIRGYLLEKGESMMIRGLRMVFRGDISPITLLGTIGYWTDEEVRRAKE